MFNTTTPPRYLPTDQQLDAGEAGIEKESSPENQAEEAGITAHIDNVRGIHERFLQKAQELGFYTEDEANEKFSINILLDPAAGEGADKDRDTNLRLAAIQGLIEKLNAAEGLKHEQVKQLEEQIAALVLEQAYADLVIFRKRLIARLHEERKKFAGMSTYNQISSEKLSELKKFAHEIDLMVFNFSNYTEATEKMIDEFDKPEYLIGSQAIVELNSKLATELGSSKTHLPEVEDRKSHIFGMEADRFRSTAPRIIELVKIIENKMKERGVEDRVEDKEVVESLPADGGEAEVDAVPAPVLSNMQVEGETSDIDSALENLGEKIDRQVKSQEAEDEEVLSHSDSENAELSDDEQLPEWLKEIPE